MKLDRNEEWRDVVGFEGVYQVSNYGRVRSLDRYVMRKDNSKMFVKGQILKGHYITKGYLQIMLYNGGKRRITVIHRLVAEAFLPPPLCEGMFIDHINMKKDDNRAENLEWVTAKENTKRAWEKGACDETLKSRSKQVYNIQNNTLYPSIIGASRETGIPYATLRYYVEKNRRGWRFA